jgi:adenylate cyclase
MRASASATSPLDLGHLWRWLLAAADEKPSIDRLFVRFCAELERRGLPIWRAVLGLEILHPEISGSLVVWTADDVEVRRATRAVLKRSDEYQLSPTRIVDETDRAFRRKLHAPCPDIPLLEDLRLAGATEYVLHPLPFLDRSRTATMGFTTRRPGGFTAEEDAALVEAMRLFSPYAEREVLSRIAVDLMETYVGARTGRRVIEGLIERGSSEIIEAAIWHADLRSFTRLSETRPTAEVIERLNAWLDPMVSAIQEHDGEVLKFIGDAVLAIFPTGPARTRAQACRDALAAARAFVDGPPGDLDYGLALHAGEVAYGNIGAARRLDFTVIGPAVNRAARLQDVAKALSRRVVISRAFAELVEAPLVELGRFELRGIERPQRVFGLPG